MRYLLIDYIKEYEEGKSIEGIKNVAMSEDFLEFHFPKNPIMPGVMLLEALTQLAGWLVAASSDFQNWFLVSKVKKSSFYGLSLPGDQVKLDVQLISEDGSGQITFKGLGTVNGKKKIMTEFAGDIVPLNELDDVEDQKNFFKILTRTLKR
jgi:3-hydroxyacyl-[acyl-carrier-protein] dehydratase